MSAVACIASSLRSDNRFRSCKSTHPQRAFRALVSSPEGAVPLSEFARPTASSGRIFSEMILEPPPSIGNVAPRRFAVLTYVRLADRQWEHGTDTSQERKLCRFSAVPARSQSQFFTALEERKLPMKRLVTCLVIVCGLSGCRGSQTSFNTLAPFGSSRVPPPSTNHFNASSPYYNRNATPQTATPAAPGSTPPASQSGGGTSGQVLSNTSASNSAATWVSPVRQAITESIRPALDASSQSSGIQAVSYQDIASNESSLRLKGMRVNDATHSNAISEPARFVPAGATVEIAQLPAAPTGSAPAPANTTVVASAQASDQAVPVSAASQSTLNWKSRP